jgi:hypothetical protein
MKRDSGTVIWSRFDEWQDFEATVIRSRFAEVSLHYHGHSVALKKGSVRVN